MWTKAIKDAYYLQYGETLEEFVRGRMDLTKLRKEALC